jgi:hypothetical protein
MNSNNQRLREIIFHDPPDADASPPLHAGGNGDGNVLAPLLQSGATGAKQGHSAIFSTITLSEVGPFLDDLERNYPPRPYIDEEFIQDTASAPVRDGKEIVREHHRVRFRKAYGAAYARLLGHFAEMEANYAGLKSSATRLDETLTATPMYLEEAGEGVHWTAWDRCKCVIIIGSGCFFIFVEMFSTSTTLAETGIPSFQSPARAWFYTAVPPGFAFCLKLLRDWLGSKLDKRIYAAALTSLAVVLSILWLWFFAATFPGITQSPSDMVTSLSLSSTPVDPRHSGSWLIFFGLSAAAFVAAACWTAVEALVESHRIARWMPNENYGKTQADLNHLRPVLEKQGVLVSRARKMIERIDKELQDYLAEGDNLYNTAEAAAGYGRAAYLRMNQKS